MSICFVIQPFDGGGFDKRYDEVFSPAIEAAGLTAYRVDRDPGVTIPIDEIESGIKNATICLADITVDNPNVWYELGFALAAQKELVLVCGPDRTANFPFDVRHRRIITYATQSTSDFESLKQRITERLLSIIKKNETLSEVKTSSVLKPVAGLNQVEIMTLATIAENILSPRDRVAAWSIWQDMEKSGFTRIAMLLGLKSLVDRNFIESTEETDHNGEPYELYTVLSKGWDWIMANQDKFQINKPFTKTIVEDDIPF